MLNREVGATPTRSRRCEVKFLFSMSLNIMFGKAKGMMKLSQKNCLRKHVVIPAIDGKIWCDSFRIQSYRFAVLL